MNISQFDWKDDFFGVFFLNKHVHGITIFYDLITIKVGSGYIIVARLTYVRNKGRDWLNI